MKKGTPVYYTLDDIIQLMSEQGTPYYILYGYRDGYTYEEDDTGTDALHRNHGSKDEPQAVEPAFIKEAQDELRRVVEAHSKQEPHRIFRIRISRKLVNRTDTPLFFTRLPIPKNGFGLDGTDDRINEQLADARIRLKEYQLQIEFTRKEDAMLREFDRKNYELERRVKETEQREKELEKWADDLSEKWKVVTNNTEQTKHVFNQLIGENKNELIAGLSQFALGLVRGYRATPPPAAPPVGFGGFTVGNEGEPPKREKPKGPNFQFSQNVSQYLEYALNKNEVSKDEIREFVGQIKERAELMRTRAAAPPAKNEPLFTNLNNENENDKDGENDDDE